MPKKSINIIEQKKIFKTNLEELVYEKYRLLLSSINLGFNSLFCEVGILINNTEDSKSIRKEIQKNLVSLFNVYLSVDSLSDMCALAKRCTSAKVKYAVALINLNYLPFFLNLKEDDAWVFYAELIYTSSLNPIEIQKRIEDNEFEKLGKKINHDKYSFMFANSKPFYQNTFKLYFKNKGIDNFSNLIEPRENHYINLELQIGSKGKVNQNTIVDIYKRILAFQSEINHDLNITFNLMFWEIGLKLIEQSKFLNISILEIIDHPNIVEICKIDLHIFNRKDLSYCLKFAIAYPEKPPIAEIIQTVSWPYIKILLDIDNVDKQKYVASYVLKNGITIERLIEMINNGYFDFELTTDHLQEIRVDKTVEITATIENNFRVTGTMETIESNIHPEHDLNRNIFKNPDLLKFLQENYLNN